MAVHENLRDHDAGAARFGRDELLHLLLVQGLGSGNGFGVQGLGSTGLCVCDLGLFIGFWVWELSCLSSKSWGWQHSMMRATGLATTGEKTVSISSCNKLSFMCAYHYIHANTNNLRTRRPLI